MTIPSWVLDGRKLRESATPGPWMFNRVSHDDGDFSWERNQHDQGFIAIYESHFYSRDLPRARGLARSDAQFIAAAPEYQAKLEKALEIAIETIIEITNPSSEEFKNGNISSETYALWCNLLANKTLSEIHRLGEV